LLTADVNLAPGLPPGHEIVEVKPRLWDLRVEGPLGPLLQVLAGLPVKDIEVMEARLEDVTIKRGLLA
jgi:hypothetical protein